MKKTILTLSVIALMAVSCNCNQNAKKETEEATSMEQSMTEMTTEMPAMASYVGTYEGVLPCADCEGLNVTLTINEDSFSSKESSDKGSFENKGSVSFNAETGVLTLTGTDGMTNLYKVKDNAVVMLDADGNEVMGELASHYVLTKK
ncbi:MAG: copper resistance protein NlpE [Capnocytophaga sp.]|nr:copper resistance protein NlpE [Capnocytophaga sp.]